MVTSIVILTYNQLELTKQCVESIYKHTDRSLFELIFVDNGSTDGTVEYLSAMEDVKCQFNETNQGFARGCNQGLSISEGDDVLFLNNDTVMTPRWLEPLQKELHADENVGMVGPVSNYVSGAQLVGVDYTDLAHLDDFAVRHQEQYAGQTKRTLRLVGFCLLAKRSLMESLGGFDERYSIGSFEDDDLSAQVVHRGYQLKIVKESFVHHHGHATFTGNDDLDIYHLYMTNRVKFIEKWRTDISAYMFPRNELVNLVPLTATKVLDIGCGAGASGLEIVGRNSRADVYGIEKEKSLCDFSKHHYAHVQIVEKYEHTDFSQLPNDFDAIVIQDVLNHTVNPWQFIMNIAEYLKPGGMMVMSVPNFMHSSVVIPMLEGKWQVNDGGVTKWSHLRHFTPFTVDDLFPSEHFNMRVKTYTQLQQDEKQQAFLQDIQEAGKKHGISVDHLAQLSSMYQIILQVEWLGGEKK
ncbi:glycosyltransferase [Geomicrobium sp. JSM 1781026]|uniref:glycosyltransferase n=1 Tax=Geomicrobium sp. JSM 1781026 TaxID=3344580 RepID=UPI0035C0194E